jgi:hypothetical protein
MSEEKRALCLAREVSASSGTRMKSVSTMTLLTNATNVKMDRIGPKRRCFLPDLPLLPSGWATQVIRFSAILLALPLLPGSWVAQKAAFDSESHSSTVS